MVKNDIINILKKYNFDNDKYLVISGAAMVLLGIKSETSDIDIAVTYDYYQYLLDNYNCKFERINEYGALVWYIDEVINFSISYFSDKCVWVFDIPVQIPEEILELKCKLKRDKDKIDSLLIKKYILKQNEKL